jgi:ParB family chromosome partitioning protein
VGEDWYVKRKDLLKSAFASTAGATPPVEQSNERVPSGAVRAMGLRLGRIEEDAARAAILEQQIASGEAILELDPLKVEPSFVDDRLDRTSDPEFRRLVDSIASDGQQVPILVRTHPKRDGYFQVAYGHRRLSACTELNKSVKAIVRALTDQELVVAQGKENAERRNLSFIERAMFATHLEIAGFERSTIQSALSVHPAELTRLLAVVRGVPKGVIAAIGPAPRAGRPRWLELAKFLELATNQATLSALLNQRSFQNASSDVKFDLVLRKLRAAEPLDEGISVFRNPSGSAVVRAEQNATTLRLTVDLKAEPGLDGYLLDLLPQLIADFPRSS